MPRVSGHDQIKRGGALSVEAKVVPLRHFLLELWDCWTKQSNLPSCICPLHACMAGCGRGISLPGAAGGGTPVQHLKCIVNHSVFWGDYLGTKLQLCQRNRRQNASPFVGIRTGAIWVTILILHYFLQTLIREFHHVAQQLCQVCHIYSLPNPDRSK